MKLRNSNTITKNNLLKESDVTEIWQQDENGNFKNLDFKGTKNVIYVSWSVVSHGILGHLHRVKHG